MNLIDSIKELSDCGFQINQLGDNNWELIVRGSLIIEKRTNKNWILKVNINIEDLDNQSKLHIEVDRLLGSNVHESSIISKHLKKLTRKSLDNYLVNLIFNQIGQDRTIQY